jgi:hypothetical protein
MSAATGGGLFDAARNAGRFKVTRAGSISSESLTNHEATLAAGLLHWYAFGGGRGGCGSVSRRVVALEAGHQVLADRRPFASDCYEPQGPIEAPQIVHFGGHHGMASPGEGHLSPRVASRLSHDSCRDGDRQLSIERTRNRRWTRNGSWPLRRARRTRATEQSSTWGHVLYSCPEASPATSEDMTRMSGSTSEKHRAVSRECRLRFGVSEHIPQRRFYEIFAPPHP